MSDKQSLDMQVPELKAGAQVKITVGGIFIQRLQKCFENHIVGQEKELKEMQAKGQIPYENMTPWEKTAVMYSTLLGEIMRLGKEQGQIEDASLRDSILRSSQQEGSDHS